MSEVPLAATGTLIGVKRAIAKDFSDGFQGEQSIATVTVNLLTKVSADGAHATPSAICFSMYAVKSVGRTRNRRPIFTNGIFLSQRRERTAHGVALSARAAP